METGELREEDVRGWVLNDRDIFLNEYYWRLLQEDRSRLRAHRLPQGREDSSFNSVQVST